MRQPPRDPREAILSGPTLRAVAIYGALIAAVTIAAFHLGGTTCAFMTLALAQILHLVNARSTDPVLAPGRAFRNRAALGAALLAIGLQLLTVFLEPLGRVLRVTPLSGREWTIVVGLGVLPMLIGQGAKTLRARLELPRGLNPGEVADHEDQVHQPECEPHRPDGKKPNREEDQARIEEQQGVTEQPEAIASPGVQSPLCIIDPAAKRGAVVMEGCEHERERRHTHHD
jgi:hypothetical protein